MDLNAFRAWLERYIAASASNDADAVAAPPRKPPATTA
jgi:hypothetical protein